MKFSTLILLIVGVTAISIHNQVEESSGLESLRGSRRSQRPQAEEGNKGKDADNKSDDEDVDFDALSPEDKAAWVFKKFDTNKNKELTWREISEGLRNTFRGKIRKQIKEFRSQIRT